MEEKKKTLWRTKEGCECGSDEVVSQGDGMHDHAMPFRCLEALEKQPNNFPACEITKCKQCGRIRIIHAGEWLEPA